LDNTVSQSSETVDAVSAELVGRGSDGPQPARKKTERNTVSAKRAAKAVASFHAEGVGVIGVRGATKFTSGTIGRKRD
jgi:hypothetical protein